MTITHMWNLYIFLDVISCADFEYFPQVDSNMKISTIISFLTLLKRDQLEIVFV